MNMECLFFPILYVFAPFSYPVHENEKSSMRNCLSFLRCFLSVLTCAVLSCDFQIKYTHGETIPITYCAQVSVKEYENARFRASLDAMDELLETIIRDKRMTVKEKKKRLKQVGAASRGYKSYSREILSY